MALSFAAGSVTLASWGFSASDIAVLAGAGRSGFNWLMAQTRDLSLLEFMKVDPDDLISRKGLIDLSALHDRWDAKLILLKNGQKHVIEPSGGKAVENMNKFTWLMALVVSSLDACLSLANVRKVMIAFLMALFQEQTDGLEYIFREVPHHIQSWMSVACVRNITLRARQEWMRLAALGEHPAGQIPTGDAEEITRFLVWIAGAGKHSAEKRFETFSADVFCLAKVLRSIGLDLIETCVGPAQHDESRLSVIFNPASFKTPQQELFALRHRSGMRVPLDCMQECVSLWPGIATKNNQRRMLFENGMHAARDIVISVGISNPNRKTEVDPTFNIVYYVFHHKSFQPNLRLDGDIYRFVILFFPLVTPPIAKGVEEILALRPAWKSPNIKDLWHYLSTDKECLADIQTFAMGFYYGTLQSLLDTSQLSAPEVFGSWGWYDYDLMEEIRDIIKESQFSTEDKPWATTEQTKALPHDDPLAFQRLIGFKKNGMLKLLALFFAGADKEQLRRLSLETVGIHAKLSIFNASLLGNIDHFQKAGKFVLIDIDPSCIPSTAKGLIMASEPRMLYQTTNLPSDKHIQRIEDVKPGETEDDLTSHVEPDWDYDVQACCIVFRYNGRLIHRFSPIELEYTVLHDAKRLGSLNTSPLERDNIGGLKQVLVADLESFSKWIIGRDYSCAANLDPDSPPILVPTRGCAKARTCLRTLYMLHDYERLFVSVAQPEIDWLIDPEMEHSERKDYREAIVLYLPTVVENEAEKRQLGRRIILV